MKHNFSVKIAALLILVTPELRSQEMIPLDEVVRLAVEKNYNVQLARNSSTSAQTDDQYAFGAYLPLVNSVGSKTWNTNDQKQLLADNSERKRNGIKSENLSGSIQLSWLLFDGTRMFAARERIAEIAEQGELYVKNEMVNTIASVINNYYLIVALKQQLRATQEQMAVSEERVKLAERKLQVGTGGKPELLQAQVDLNAQRTQVIQQATAIRQLKDQLDGLVGLNLPNEFDVADSIVIDLNISEDEILSGIENKNYGLLAARKNIGIANLSLRERKGELFPFLYFNSNYNFSRTENEVAINSFTPLFNENKGFNYGFSVSLPLLNGFDRRRRIRQAHITIDREPIQYEQQKALVDVDIRNAFDDYENAKNVLLVEEETILLARENVFIALEGFKRGVTTFIELRTAQISLESAYTRLITARYNAKVAETELLKLSGSLIQSIPEP